MNKIWGAIIAVFVCTIGILGTYCEIHSEPEAEPESPAAGDVIYFDEVSYTDAELQEMYENHNITENDIKFARGELPNYLEGTILQSDLRVIVSETGEPPEGLVKGEHYDVVLSEQEMSKIMGNARAAYIEKYGVDPASPKLDKVNGYLIPTEDAEKLVFI